MKSQSYKYRSTIVAKYIIAKANEKKIVINMTKLQKLLYATYGLYLAVTGERLTDEQPRAWPYGPVFPTSRENLLGMSDFAAFKIDDDPDCMEIREDKDVTRSIDLILDAFGKYSAGQLTEWSHQTGSPWDQTQCSRDFKWNDSVPD